MPVATPAVETETGGAAKPPKETPPTAAAVVPPDQRTCPETGERCKDGCVLPDRTGKTYCVVWVARQRAAK